MGAISIRELAKLANVSPSTVSRALNNHPELSEETKERIRRLAAVHHYRPNALVKGIFTGQTKTIGVILADVAYPFYPNILKGINDVFFEHGYSVFIHSSYNDPDREARALHMLAEQRVDGLIISPVRDDANESYFQELRQENRPFVVIDRQLEGVAADFVGTDDLRGAYRVTEHLIKLGYKDIVHISGPREASTCIDRAEGYRRAMGDHLLEPQVIYNERAFTHPVESGYWIMDRLAEEGAPLPRAFFTVTDSVAIGVMNYLLSKGVRIPEEVALAGYANLDNTEYLAVPLTTVNQPRYEIGRVAAELLLRRLKARAKGKHLVEVEKRFLETNLVIRSSCGARLKRDGVEALRSFGF